MLSDYHDKKEKTVKQQIKNSQRGAAHLVLVLAFVVALVGVLGFLGYSTWQKQNANAGGDDTLGRRPADDIGITCTATFGGVKNQAGNKVIYGKVTVKNASNENRKVAVTLRATGDRRAYPPKDGWYADDGWNAKEVRLSAKDSFTDSWKSAPMHNADGSQGYKVVAVYNPHGAAEKDITCKSESYKLLPVPSPHF